MSNGPITDVSSLSLVSSEVAAAVKQAARIGATGAAPAAAAPAIAPAKATSPGKERWPVKTGMDKDVAEVGKNVIGGRDLGKGIVPTTVEELVTAPRPPQMPDPAANYDKTFHDLRVPPSDSSVETTIWQLDATITALKLEADGDYHLVLQGDGGETMIGEVPTPTSAFVGNSPWQANIQAARAAVDDKLVRPLNPQNFVPFAGKLVPRGAVSGAAAMPVDLPASFAPSVSGQPSLAQPFKTKVPPTRARLTGVGFFDAVHGQLGVSSSNGIELHPVLKIEWL